MSLNQFFISELKQEAASTRKILERVPLDNGAWKPHEKSMSLGRIATHIAEIPHWVEDTVTNNEVDFATKQFSRHIATSTEELLSILDKNVENAIAALEKATDEEFAKTWSMRSGEKVFYTLSKLEAVRRFAFSHWFHHRGQLSVYLRLLDVPVPGMYGPSADER